MRQYFLPSEDVTERQIPSDDTLSVNADVDMEDKIAYEVQAMAADTCKMSVEGDEKSDKKSEEKYDGKGDDKEKENDELDMGEF